MNNPRFLTKSRFAIALGCPTKLYYQDENRNSEYANLKKDDEFLQALANGGFQVGELAKYYFLGGVPVKSSGYEEPLSETNEYLRRDNVIIFEAAVSFSNFFVRVDILVKEGNHIKLIEVKSKSYRPDEDFEKRTGGIDRDWEPYLYDVAFQTWVAEQAFPEWEIEPFLMMANKDSKTSVDGLNQLFKIVQGDDDRWSVEEIPRGTVTPEILGDRILIDVPVREYVDMIMAGTGVSSDRESQTLPDLARKYSEYYDRDERYPVEIGVKCKKCEFKLSDDARKLGLKSGYEECWRDAVGDDFDFNEPHVFEIGNYSSKKDLENGIYYMKDVQIESTTATAERQKLQTRKTCFEKGGESLDPGLFNEINKWKYPFHFIDFETCIVAIPFTAGRHPYEYVAFQYSCHSLYENGEIKHKEWINVEPGVFPNFDFVKALKGVLSADDGTILHYSHYENTVLRQIRDQLEYKTEIGGDDALYSELINWIDEVTRWEEKDEITGKKLSYQGDRCMVDMLELVKKYYYHPLMKGSNSIKAVLPAVMFASKYLKEKYSQPLNFGSNLLGEVLWKYDSETNKPIDPYKLLDEVCGGLRASEDDMDEEVGSVIASGGDAMTAYAELQFSDMTGEKRENKKNELKHYCELDTLAMLMIYEHWNSQKDQLGSLEDIEVSREEIKEYVKKVYEEHSDLMDKLKDS